MRGIRNVTPIDCKHVAILMLVLSLGYYSEATSTSPPGTSVTAEITPNMNNDNTSEVETTTSNPQAATVNGSNDAFTDSLPDKDETRRDVESGFCEWMTEQEREFTVSFTVTADNITVKEWQDNFDGPFREEMAECLKNASQSGVTKDDLRYVNPSPYLTKEENASVQIIIFLSEEKIEVVKNAENATANVSAILKMCGNQSAAQLLQEYKVGNITVGLSGPECSSLFVTYLPLWIALIAAAFLCLVLTVVITWYCWKRGKSVQLKHDSVVKLPSTDELRYSNETRGEDNPALDITAESSPSKKKQAPQPPTSTPNMTTFGKGAEPSATVEYETAVAPYEEQEDAAPANGSAAKAPMAIEDTKL